MINTGFIWGVFGEVGVAGGEAWLLDPRVARMVGRKARPWNTPYNTVRPNTLKKVMKTWEAEKGRMMTASRVVMPAFTMAGPRVTRAFCALSVLEPERFRIIKPEKLFHLLTLRHGERVGNVDGVVDAEAAGEDNVHADDHVDGHVPEVQSPNLQGGLLRYTD